MIPAVLQYLPKAQYEVGIHAIRITADQDNPGLPAPEGPHQDGDDYTVLLCVSRENVEGAVTTLSPVGKPDVVVFEGTLMPGDLLIVDDRVLTHFTSPVNRAVSNLETHRDVFSLGLKAINTDH